MGNCRPELTCNDCDECIASHYTVAEIFIYLYVTSIFLALVLQDSADDRMTECGRFV